MLKQKGFSGRTVFFDKPFSQKGFLGPIGDDLPSLIPLVFALTIFFGVFYITFNSFNEKSQAFDNDTSAIQISAALRGTGLISSPEQFQKLCSNINIRNINFAAGIIKAKDFENIIQDSTYVEFQEFIDYSGTFSSPDFGCSNAVEQEDIPTINELTVSQVQLIQRVYPVAVNLNYPELGEREQRITPAFLVVTIWRD